MAHCRRNRNNDLVHKVFTSVERPALSRDKQRDPDDFLMARATVQRLLGGRSHMFIKRRVEAGELPAPHYLGRHPHWWHSDVVAYVEAQPRRAASYSAENLHRTPGDTLEGTESACTRKRIARRRKTSAPSGAFGR